MDWMKPERKRRRRKYAPMLEEVKANQADHPDMWAELVRFTRDGSAAETAYRLGGTWLDYQFRSEKDFDTQEGVVYVRYTGPTE